MRSCREYTLFAMKKRIAIFASAMTGLLAARLVVMKATPLFEPSEARYAAISANMARTGDFLVPSFTYKGTYRPFAGKPPLVFQASGMFCRIFGVSEFAARLVPFLSFAALLVLLFVVVRRLAHIETGMLAAGICSTSVAIYATAGFCMTDVPLTLCSSGALLLYLLHRNGTPQPSLRIVIGIATLLGSGMLVKGPVALALFGLPVVADAAINRKWKHILSIRWLLGAVIFVVISAPWFCMMENAQPGFVRYFFINENLLRFLVHDYGDMYGSGRETFRGMALIWALVVTMPWSLVAPFRPRCMGLHALRSSFPLLASAVITAFWCMTSRVPLAYLLPIVPLFAAHLALYGTRDEPCRSTSWRVFPFAAATSAILLVTTLMVVLAFAPDKMPGAAAEPTARKSRFSYEFYNGPWGKGAPKELAK